MFIKKHLSVVYLIAAWEVGFKTAAQKCTFISPAASSELCFATLKMHPDQKKKSKVPHAWRAQIKRNCQRNILPNTNGNTDLTGVGVQPPAHRSGTRVRGSRFPRWTRPLFVFSFYFFICRRQIEIANVLKFEHFVAPAGPPWLKISGKQLQALGLSSNIWLQHLCEWERGFLSHYMALGPCYLQSPLCKLQTNHILTFHIGT